MSESCSNQTYATAFEGAALIYARNFERLISIAHAVEERPFSAGIWQHFPQRRKWYPTTDEFYVLQGDPQGVLDAIAGSNAGPDQVIDVIGLDPVQDDAAYRAAGYERDSVEILMDRPITPADAHIADDPRVVGALTDAQIDRLAEVWNQGRTANGYRPILPAHNTTLGLVQRYVELDGVPAAYGRAIAIDGDALLADVNAFPGFRRQGLGRAVMLALHSGLARLGANRVVLTSTAMGLPLYEQLGYRRLAEDWIYATPRREAPAGPDAGA
ncbi:MAG: GNAT family N-acetyltransferase [Thermomicrobiales bacterium]|nr:GNAT family N-acetyltransferase [Thermomicrobiales bacterium]